MSAQDLLSKTNHLREEGDLLGSLTASDESLVASTEEENSALFAETLAAKALTLRHLYQKTNNKNYLFVAKAEMEASVEIAKSLDDKSAIAIPLFNLAKVYQELENSELAIKYFKEAVDAIEQHPPITHNRPAVKADFKIHLAAAEAKNGDETAVNRLKQHLHQLEEISDEDSFNKKVWTSGAYMQLATLLKEKNKDEAYAYLQKAKDIIDGDDRLILRKKQWEKLAQNFN